MDWQAFLQWFFIVASGASIFGAWLAWASKTNGNETRELLRELHKENQIILSMMDKTAEERNKRAEERHQEVIEFFKKGFSENN